MSLFEKKISELPSHITNSQHYVDFLEMHNTMNDSDTNFYVNPDVYAETLEIRCQSDIHKIIASDAYFGFSFDDRVKILRNINMFWLLTEEHIILPDPNISFFSREVNTLLTEKMSLMVMKCMKLNYSELLEYTIQDKFPRTEYMFSHTDLYFAACNSSVDCFKIGIKHGFEINKHTVAIVAEKGNMEMLQLMVDANCPRTSMACEDAEKVEVLEFLLKHGFKMHYTTIEKAAKKGNSAKMEFAINNGCEIPKNICELAGQGGNPECLRLAFANAPDSSQSIMYNIIKKDKLEAFHIAMQNGILVDHQCLAIAIENRCLNITPAIVRKHMK